MHSDNRRTLLRLLYASHPPEPTIFSVALDSVQWNPPGNAFTSLVLRQPRNLLFPSTLGGGQSFRQQELWRMALWLTRSKHLSKATSNSPTAQVLNHIYWRSRTTPVIKLKTIRLARREENDAQAAA